MSRTREGPGLLDYAAVAAWLAGWPVCLLAGLGVIPWWSALPNAVALVVAGAYMSAPP